MPKMKFDKEQFRDGLNVTVRLGSKWHDKLDVDGTFKAGNKTAEVVGKMICPVGMLNEGILKYEHDPKARTVWGLRHTLEDVYNRSIESSEYVSVIFFELVKIG